MRIADRGLRIGLRIAVATFAFAIAVGVAAQPPTVTAIRAGRLLDPEAGRILINQIILVEGTKIREVGPAVAIPAGAQIIDLSRLTVMPGLVEAPNHLARAHTPDPENNTTHHTY